MMNLSSLFKNKQTLLLVVVLLGTAIYALVSASYILAIILIMTHSSYLLGVITYQS